MSDDMTELNLMVGGLAVLMISVNPEYVSPSQAPWLEEHSDQAAQTSSLKGQILLQPYCSSLKTDLRARLEKMNRCFHTNVRKHCLVACYAMSFCLQSFENKAFAG